MITSSAQVAESVGEPKAEQGDTDAYSSFIEKPWLVTPSTMTCRMILSVFLPATPMQPSLKTCISLKTVSFLPQKRHFISQVGMCAQQCHD